MIKFTFTDRPLESRIELFPLFTSLALLTIINKYPKKCFSISQLQAYLWGLLSHKNIEKLYLIKKYQPIDVIPLYDVPNLNGILGECQINNFIQMKDGKFQITKEGQFLMEKLKNEDLVKDIEVKISRIGYLGNNVLDNLNLHLDYA